MDVVSRNWEDLPPEILHLIVNKLPDICDFIRLRAVCKTWRTCVSVSDMPPQFPWIMKRNKSAQHTLQFYSIALEKFYNIPLPDSANEKFFQPASMFSHRYGCDDQFSLLGCEQPRQFGKKYFSLLNPLNNTEVRLPFSDDAQLSGVWINPRCSQREVLQILSNGTRQLALCKPNNGNRESIRENSVYKYIYLKGFVFTVNRRTKVTSVIDISSGETVYLVPPPDCEISEGLFLKGPFLVGSSQDVLSVCYTYSNKMERYQFYVHRLDLGNGNKHPCWVRVTSIDKQILFFDFIECRSFSMSVNDFPGFKGNSIFFITWKTNWSFLAVYYVYKYDIENGKTECIDCPFCSRGFTWFQPSLHHV